ncbi:SDR family NAD(P)-dependent oxidoreductase [Siphonobacter sp. SORGH_AS_1065]|uniref:SDR family NAD(P)-dependent oxidoreductase n=1 Tax=Siphonobacter sp. SORGH_AS_1065 TaxID=3041795 RepID=UPI002786AFE4|nr:SDR family oxidoreductase [Siphonobacter sp. SORGH_AS_1065]MDQ1088626.1 3-oxoacyl-[acyl-carrier protein] reductase [Siphonobacter sp. SORGH_AS_1065]
MNLQGKNILIAGGSSGIGLSTVSLLHEQGANVYIVSRTAHEQWPAEVHHLALDVTDPAASVQGFLPDVLHGLVYSVGSINLKPFSRLTTDDFLQDYQLNVLGAVSLIQQSLKPLKEAKGASIVLLSSVAAKVGLPFHASIASAKAAIEGLGVSLAAEFVTQKIRVNTVAPSLTDTPLAQSLLNTSEKQEASAKRHPLGRIGQPEDIGNLIAFLLSDQSSWITGQVIGVDGGLGHLKN